MGLKDIVIETKVYQTELYGHSWEIEVKLLSYKAKQEYIAVLLKNKKIKENEIELNNITANDLIEPFKTLFFAGLKSLKIDGADEEISKDTYEYLINNLSNACEWLQECIIDFNGNFFLARK